MTKIRIRKGNPSGRTEDVLDVFGLKVKVDTENWVEIDDTDFQLISINPTLYEVEGEKPAKKKRRFRG